MGFVPPAIGARKKSSAPTIASSTTSTTISTAARGHPWRFLLLVLVGWQLALLFCMQQLFVLFLNYVPHQLCRPSLSDPTHENCLSLTNGTCASCRWNSQCGVWCGCDTDSVMARSCSCIDNFAHIDYRSYVLEMRDAACEQPYVVFKVESAQYLGILFGTITFGIMSDRIGRRSVLLISLILGQIVLLGSTYFSADIPMSVFYAARALVGFFNGGTLVVGVNYCMELVRPGHRILLRAFSNWPNARLIMTLIAYLTRDNWRHTVYVMTIVSAPSLLIFTLVLPESPMWLRGQGRLKEMRAAYERIAYLSGTPIELPPIISVQPVPVHRMRFIDLLRNDAVRSRLLMLWVMWFVASFSAYVIDLNSAHVSSDLFAGQLASVISISLAKLLLCVADSYWRGLNRRRLHQVSQLTGVLAFVAIVILLCLRQQETPLYTVLYVLGTVAIDFTWDACYLCAPECMPTEVRGLATGSCSLFARVGNIAATMAGYLNEYVWTYTVAVMLVVIGTTNLVLSYLFLKETKNVDMNDVSSLDGASRRASSSTTKTN